MITKKSTNQENTKIYQSPIIPQNPQIIQRDHTKPRPKFTKTHEKWSDQEQLHDKNMNFITQNKARTQQEHDLNMK